MYITVKEAAEYLEMPEQQVRSFVHQGRIRAVHDGDQFLINKDQFTTHMEQVEKYRKLMQDYWSEPIPEDIDVKDED